jgi:hypothetical protein
MTKSPFRLPTRHALAPLLSLLLGASGLPAQVVTPVSVTASTFYGASQTPNNLINGNGLLGAGDILTRTHAASGSAETMWHSTGGAVASEWLVFDLGAQFSLTGAHIWQMNQPCCLGRGIKDFSLFVSSNTTDPREAFTFVGSFSLTQGTGLNTLAQQALSFNASNVRRVMFAISNCWSGSVNDYVGLSEVRFAGTAPATIATEPADGTNYVWGIHTFAVAAGGTPPLAYQWFGDGTPPTAIADSTNSTCKIDPVELASAGRYFVIVTGPNNSVTSRVATLTVQDPTPDYASDLVAYYTFDETSGITAADTSGNGTGATLFNFPFDDSMWVTGRVGGALHFNATDAVNNNQVVTDAGFNLTNEDQFTFAFWAKRRSDSNPFNPRIIGPVSAVDGQYWVVWAPSLNGIGFYPPATSPVPIRDIWQHFVITYDRVAGKYETYVDGRKKAEAINAGYLKNPPAGRQWAIGCKEILTDFRDPWRGYLDDLRVYNRILLPGDVKALFEFAGSVAPSFDIQPVGMDLFAGDTLMLYAAVDGTPPVTYQWMLNGTNALPGATNLSLTISNMQPANAGAYTLVAANIVGSTTSAVAQVTVTPIASVITGLGGYWKFDESAGDTAADSSGRGSHGTVGNYTLDGAQWTAGRVSGALNFRGAGFGGDHVIVPAWPRAANGVMSMSAWVWADARPDWASILCGGSGIDGVGQFTANLYPGTGDFVAFVQSSSRLQTGIREGVALPLGEWQHLAMVADGALVRIYRNGTPVGSTAYNGTLFNPANSLSMGATLAADGDWPHLTSPDYWEGKLDEVAYWTRSLAANEVFALYAAGVSGQPVSDADDFLNSPPIIISQPESLSAVLQDPFTLAVTVASPSVPTYQWRKDGTAMVNATDRLYTDPSAVLTDAGDYTVVVTANSLSVTSAPATVTVVTPPIQPEVGMIVHLKLDEASGSSAADASGNGNTGTLLNFLDPDASWMPGILDGALNFSQGAPAADAVMVPDLGTLEFGPNPFSLSLWAKGAAAQVNSGGLLCKGVGGQESYCVDYVNGSFRFFVRDSAGQVPGNVQINAGVGPNDEWQHLAVIYDPAVGQSRMYVNGVLRGTAATAPSVYYNGSSLDIGARQAIGGGSFAYPWNGLLDDVRVYGRAINPLEVRALTYHGIAPALTITGDGASVTLTWPLEAIGYELVSRADLATGAWTVVPGVTGNSIALPATGAAKFFALRRL